MDEDGGNLEESFNIDLFQSLMDTNNSEDEGSEVELFPENEDEEMAGAEGRENISPPPEEEGTSSQPNSQELDAIVSGASAPSTNRATKWGLNRFNSWNIKRKRNINLATISAQNLNYELRKFYGELKSTKGNSLTPSALTGIRAAIHRHLINPPLSRNLNIIKDSEFTTSNQMYQAKCRLYYKEGNKKPQHKPPIAEGDMTKLCEYFKKYTSDATVLIQFIWFSFCLYFGRRGREGWRSFATDSFKLETDDKDRRFITFTKTESTKNHPGGDKSNDQDYSDQRLYETEGQLNPIEAYLLYMSKLHPSCNAFFQTPRTNYKQEEHWYRNEPIGKNTIARIMQTISKAANLSKTYTCHSVRATTITTLGRRGLQNSDIIKITKHKNEASLKHYFDDLSTEQKKDCTTILSNALEKPSSTSSQLALPVPSTSATSTLSLPQPSSSGVITEHFEDGTIAVTIPDIHNQQVTHTKPPVVPERRYLQNLLPNCKFDGCTININTVEQK